MFLFLTPGQWRIGIIFSLAMAGVVLWFTGSISPWIGVSVGLSALVAYHMSYGASHVLALPHIAILIACLQYVLAAWMNFYWPPANPTYDIGGGLPFYLSYAGPVLIALTVGWALALLRLNPPRHAIRPQTDSRLLVELDLLLGFGVVFLVLSKVASVGSVDFVFLLLGNLRYVSVFARMIMKGIGWSWRLGLVLGAEAGLAVGRTMFHDLLLWSAWTFAIWVYAFRPRVRTVVVICVAGILLLPALQEAKWRLRVDPWEDDPIASEQLASAEVSPMQQGILWLRFLGPGLWHTITLSLEPDFIADVAVRYNQGWIVNRVMSIVPQSEPYAQGTTLKEAALAALLPRIISSEKFTAGGREHMLRYAGMDLGGDTAMTLGFAGEMYANFGPTGGTVACGIYALLFGLFFRAICRRAFRRPLWWSLVPFIFYAALKAEDDVAFVLNWTAKGGLVFVAVILVLPHFRRGLFGPIEIPPRVVIGQTPPASGGQTTGYAVLP